MIRDDFTVEHADWIRDAAALRAVREQVFIAEQQVSQEEEWDDLDALSYHVLAHDSSGMPIATGRLTPEHKIGRMAVVKPWRGKGVGAAILQMLIERASALDYREVELHAQVSAIGFYQTFAFECFGDEFVEANIPHRRMRLALTPFIASHRRPLPPAPLAQAYITHTREEVIQATKDILQAGSRELVIHTHDLDPGIYDQTEILAQIQHIATQGRGARIRILIQQTDHAMREGNRLIALAQRLSSIFELRVPEFNEDRQYSSAFLLNDRDGYLLRPVATRFDGDGSSYAPGRHRQLLNYFEQVWERARIADELRQLSL